MHAASGERAIGHQRTVALPRADMWRRFSTAEGLRFIVDEAKFELRPGWHYEWNFMLENPPGTPIGWGESGERLLLETGNARSASHLPAANQEKR